MKGTSHLVSALRLLLTIGLMAAAMQACKKIPASELNYNFFEGKGKIVYQDGEEDRRLNADIRMMRDSVIWISLRGGPGIEGARLLITPDSFLMVNRLTKEYFAYTFPELSETLNFDINIRMLQAIMIGNPLVLSDTSKIETVRDEYYRITTELYRNLKVQSYIPRDKRKVKNMLISDMVNGNQMEITYDIFKSVGTREIPYNSKVKLVYADTSKVATTFELDYNRVTVPKDPLKFPFVISDRFKRSYFDFGK